MARRVEEDSGIDGARLRVLVGRLSPLAPEGRWWPYDDPFEIAVSAVLTQRARWQGAALAMEALRKEVLLEPRALARARRSAVERALRPAGFYRQKARSLQEIAGRICEKYGGKWSRLAKLSTEELRSEVLSWRGVGDETADAILLFAADRPVFVVDAYTLRLMRRFGVIAPGASPTYHEAARAWRHVAQDGPGESRSLHAAIVNFSKTTCTARPRCSACPLEDACPKVGVKPA